MNSLRGELQVQAGPLTLHALLNMNAFRLMCQDMDMELKDLDTLATSNALDFVPGVLWAGVKNWCLYHGEAMPEGLDFDRFAALVLADGDALTRYADDIGTALGFGVDGDDAGK